MSESGKGAGNGRGWVKGQSGNPKGRPPGIVARDAARAHTGMAIEALVAALKVPRERVAAAVAILDRGWGKPKEQVEQINLNFDGMGIDAPALPESIEEWLERRRNELKTLQ